MLTYRPKHRTKQNRQKNEPGIPDVATVYRSDTQKHEDNRFRAARNHFQGIFYCGVRFM